MMIGNHTALSVYVPLLMAVVLGAMTYFHWHHRLKYLYLAALLLLLVYAITSAIYVSHSAVYKVLRFCGVSSALAESFSSLYLLAALYMKMEVSNCSLKSSRASE